MKLPNFRFWCQSVLPLVYDGSLSYYEVLCKCVDYINKLIETDREIFADIDGIKAELKLVQEWIANFDTRIVDIIGDVFSGLVFFGLTNDGYFVAYIPESWDDVSFSTTGWDTTVADMPYGHLCIEY